MPTHFNVSDPSIRNVRACRWQFASQAARTAASQTIQLWRSSSAVQLFDDVDQPALLAANFRSAQSEGDIAWPPVPPAGAEVEWVAEAELVARWDAKRTDDTRCLVVVRQPLARPDREAQRSWVSTVLRALEGDKDLPAGLLTASFFASLDGSLVLNFAEWTSPTAHREALARGAYGTHGSIGSSPLWRATREHPAITPQHEVHRYLQSGRPSETAQVA